jgi:hypothetical protein
MRYQPANLLLQEVNCPKVSAKHNPYFLPPQKPYAAKKR